MTSATEVMAAITTGLALAKSIYALGIEVYPNAKTFILNLINLISDMLNGKEISDERLLSMQEETTAMSEACHKARIEKYGE